jgi:hypothetical protein
MASSGMLCHVALVRTDVSEELSASIIRVTRVSELGTMLTVTSNQRMLRLVFLRSVCRLVVTANVVPSSPILVTLMEEALSASETSLLKRATWHNMPEDVILDMDMFPRAHLFCNAAIIPTKQIATLYFHKNKQNTQMYLKQIKKTKQCYRLLCYKSVSDAKSGATE